MNFLWRIKLNDQQQPAGQKAKAGYRSPGGCLPVSYEVRDVSDGHFLTTQRMASHRC